MKTLTVALKFINSLTWRSIITRKKNKDYVPELTSTTMHSAKAHRSSRLITGRRSL